MGEARLLHGDAQEQLRKLPDASVDAVVCDPPYGLSKEPDPVEVLTHWLAGDDYRHTGRGFMGKEWDSFVPGPATWRECLRVLKPGGYLLAFGGTRTYDLLVMAVRLGGFEVRDTIAWMYGQGFPKSLNVGCRCDADEGSAAAHEPGSQSRGGWPVCSRCGLPTAGLGTALKPAHEPIVVARKPFVGTVAANVLEHGTGALNVDGCRIGTAGEVNPSIKRRKGSTAHLSDRPAAEAQAEGKMESRQSPEAYAKDRAGELEGRWPANVVMDPEAGAMLDEQSGDCRSAGDYLKGAREQGAKNGAASIPIDGLTSATYADQGGASRFFKVAHWTKADERFRYCAKADRAEREAGLHGMDVRFAPTMNNGIGAREHDPTDVDAYRANDHPTVKPIDLMRWLVRLVTPPGGLVLDTHVGSGTTGCAAVLEGMEFVGIDNDERAVKIARRRIAWWAAQPQGIATDLALVGERKRQLVAETGQLGLLA